MSRNPEAALTADLLLELGAVDGLSLFKNPVGKGYYGNVRPLLEALEKKGAGALVGGWREVLYRHRVTYGLGDGSPDLVGHYRGLFLPWELKSKTGRLRKDQREWHAAELAKGAAPEIIRSVDDGWAALERAKERLKL